jgi:hypothetical protein
VSDQQDTATIVLTTDERRFITRMLLAEKSVVDDQLARLRPDASADYVTYVSDKARMLGAIVDKLDGAFVAALSEVTA